MKRPVKVLHVMVGGKVFNGIASCLYQYYRNMDINKVQFDFLFCLQNNMALPINDPIFIKSHFFVLNSVTKHGRIDYIQLVKKIRKVVKENAYDIIIVNTSNNKIVISARVAVIGVKKLKFIAYAHNSNNVDNPNSFRGKHKLITKISDNIFKWLVIQSSSFLFACSRNAGICTFGNSTIDQNNFYIIKTAIDTDAFIYNEEIRTKKRTDFHINENDIIYGMLVNCTTERIIFS